MSMWRGRRRHKTCRAAGSIGKPWAEIALFGSGPPTIFLHSRLTRAPTDTRVGFEVMDTPPAGRTVNILAAEGRRIVAALLAELTGVAERNDDLRSMADRTHGNRHLK